VRHDDVESPERQDAGNRLLVTSTMAQHRPSISRSGFTIIELMVVVAIAAILAAVAAPSFSTFIDNQRLRNASFDLVSDLLVARSEALKRQSIVVVTPTSTAGTDWSGGWSVNVGSSAGALITSRTGVTSKLRFVAKDSSSVALADLSIGADGRVVGATPVRIETRYANPVPSGVTPSCITIDATGRPKADKGACS
jgi:type IV fimbrial biogenesis protein FimT